MQTLLCAPVTPTEIVLGKFLAVWGLCVTTALANLTSLSLTLMRVARGQEVHLSAGTYLLTGSMLVPVALTTTAVFLAVAAFARDFKDGQNFLTPVYMLLVLPAGTTMLPGMELNPWTSFVPIVDVALLVKALLVGETRGDLVFLTLLATTAYATVALLFAARVFQREQILLGGRESVTALLGLTRRGGGRPSVAVALVTFACALVLAFYASLLLERQGLITMLLVTQYAFFLLPALLVVFGLGFSPRLTLSLRRPPLAGLVAAVLLGTSVWAVAGGILVRIAPPPDSLVRALQRLIMLGDRPMPLPVVWLVIAVTPAICEELFFRGVVLSGLRRTGQWPAIFISALLFGVAHASIYRLLPTLLLGVVLGYIVWKTGSIVCSMVVHAVNNGLIATMTQVPGLAATLGATGSSLGWKATAAGALLTAAGVLLLARMHPQDNDG